MAKGLRSQLQEIRQDLRPSNKKPLVITARLDETSKSWTEDNWAVFEPATTERLYVANPAHLFSLLRDAVRAATGDHTWSVRYASQVKRENIPFLHCSSSNSIIFDPFAMFRDPIREFYTKRQFVWPIMASQSYYFKPYDEVRALDAQLKSLEELSKAMAEMPVNPTPIHVPSAAVEAPQTTSMEDGNA